MKGDDGEEVCRHCGDWIYEVSPGRWIHGGSYEFQCLAPTTAAP